MKALLIVDMQYDFLPGGAMGVKGANEIVDPIVKAASEYSLIFATQDWHPRMHISFAETHNKKVGDMIETEHEMQKLWPVHCVQLTKGAHIEEKIGALVDHVVQKGTDQSIDSYSGFFDNAKKSKTQLEELLKKYEVDTLDVVGVATDYCVKYTVLDGLELGFKIRLIPSLCRAVNLNPLDEKIAIEEMKRAGCEVIDAL